jgi:hypothetical protein
MQDTREVTYLALSVVIVSLEVLHRTRESPLDMVPAILKGAGFPKLLLRVQSKEQSVRPRTPVHVGVGCK